MKNLKIFRSKEVINRVLEEVRKDWPAAFIYDLSDRQQAILLQQESDADYDQDKDLFLSEDHTAVKGCETAINLKSSFTYAFLSDKDLLNENYPKTSTSILREEWLILEFKCFLLDDEDQNIFSEKDREEGYNLLLLHPETKEIFWGYSADFDFS